MDASSRLAESKLAGPNVQSRIHSHARLLLANKGIDPEKLSRAIRAIDLKTSYEPLEPLGDTDVDG